jgi:hypothetical protein
MGRGGNPVTVLLLWVTLALQCASMAAAVYAFAYGWLGTACAISVLLTVPLGWLVEVFDDISG